MGTARVRLELFQLLDELCLSTEYQHSGEGETRSPPEMPHHLQHFIACLIKNGSQDLKIGQT